jgi:hypothetical protein
MGPVHWANLRVRDEGITRGALSTGSVTMDMISQRCMLVDAHCYGTVGVIEDSNSIENSY